MHAPEVKRAVWGGFKKFLPENHTYRAASSALGAADHDDIPAPRTHAAQVQAGLDNELHERLLRFYGTEARKHKIFKKDLPSVESGVKEACPLRFLPFFNLVWDLTGDMMHIVPVIWKTHIHGLMRGTRAPGKVTPLAKNTDTENATLLNDHNKVVHT